MEILAAIVGVLLTAAVTLSVSRYRSLIVYNIEKITLEVKVDGSRVVPASATDRYGSKTAVTAYKIHLTNKGLKGVSGVKLHARHLNNAFAFDKTAESISPETVVIRDDDESLAIEIEYFPRGETVSISAAKIEDFGGLYSITGTGKDYTCESRAFYEGQEKVKRTVLNMLAAVGAALLSVSILTTIIKFSTKPVGAPGANATKIGTTQADSPIATTNPER